MVYEHIKKILANISSHLELTLVQCPIFIIWQGSLEVNLSILICFFLSRDFAIQTVSMETIISCVFLFSKAGKFKSSMA